MTPARTSTDQRRLAAAGPFILEWKYNTPGTVMDVPSPPAIAGGRNIYFGGAGEDEAAVTSVRSTRRAIVKWRYLPAAIRPLHQLAATAR